MSLPHSLSASSGICSALGQRQKFTPEYLAKQLPVFQERVPRVAQVGDLNRVCVCVCVYGCVTSCYNDKTCTCPTKKVAHVCNFDL